MLRRAGVRGLVSRRTVAAVTPVGRASTGAPPLLATSKRFASAGAGGGGDWASRNAAEFAETAARPSKTQLDPSESPNLLEQLDLTVSSTFFGPDGLALPALPFDFLGLLATPTTALATTLGVPWPVAFFVTGAAIRLALLVGHLHAERASLRMHGALKAVDDEYVQFTRVYMDPNHTAKDFHQAASSLRLRRKLALRQHKTSTAETLIPFALGPVYLSTFLAATRLVAPPATAAKTTAAAAASGKGAAATAATVAASSALSLPPEALWLAVPEPTGALAVLCCACTVANIELTFRRKDLAGRDDPISKALPWLFRVAVVLVMPATGTLRAGPLLTWLGMGAVGLLHPLLMRSDAFRKWYGIPDVSYGAAAAGAAAAAADQGAKFRTWAPRLYHLLRPGGAKELLDSAKDSEKKRIQNYVSTTKAAGPGAGAAAGKGFASLLRPKAQPRSWNAGGGASSGAAAAGSPASRVTGASFTAPGGAAPKP